MTRMKIIHKVKMNCIKVELNFMKILIEIINNNKQS